MGSQLLITNVGHILSILVTASLIILVVSRGNRKTINRAFLLFGISTIIWELSFLVGINLVNPEWSRFAFMFNMSTFFVVIINAQFTLLITNRYEAQKKIIHTLYVIGTALAIFFLLYPDLFLKPSIPKLYFLNFFVPGPYYFVGDIFFFGVLLYGFANLIYSYVRADRIMKNRLRYYIVALVIAWGVSLSLEFLLYGIQVDPFISFLFGLYTIPMAYSIIENDLIDINIVAKRALWYAVGVATVALIVTLIGNANDAIIASIPGFPHWIVPVVSGIIAVSTAAFVWKKIREVDILKDEFINIVMHKFRTPLTYIKWSVETLKAYPANDDQKRELDNIEEEGVALVGLTNTLVNLANIGNKENSYSFSSENFPDLVEKTLTSRKLRIAMKKISVTTDINPNLPSIGVDVRRIEFAIETIIDNAIIYTPDGGNIAITVGRKENFIFLSVKDSGVGISKEDLSRLFNKFFRGAGVKTDTEGMGIGLFITKDIVKRHGGRIWAESEGQGKGAVFFLELPLKA